MARAFLGASLAILDEIGVPLVADEEIDYLATRARLDDELGSERAEALIAEGRVGAGRGRR